MEPITLTANAEALDHELSVSVRLSGQQYAGLCGRLAPPQLTHLRVANGYCLFAWSSDGHGGHWYWQMLKAVEQLWVPLDSGKLDASLAWQKLTLSMRGPQLRATVNGQPGKLVTDSTHTKAGFASLNSWWGLAHFDNFSIAASPSEFGATATDASPSGNYTADVHMPLAGDAAAAALKANAFLSTLMANEVDLAKDDQPHVTLYLTEFQPGSEESMFGALNDALYGLAPHLCNLSVTNAYAVGSYAMLNVSSAPPGCLQRYSDTVVNATSTYAVPNQPVPAWVYYLPEPERSEKIHDVQRYGSPNVFGQFQPHVTIGWAEDAASVAKAVAALARGGKGATMVGETVDVGTSGPHGTVLRDRDIATFNLTSHGDPCAQRYKDEPSCDADHVTDGGCVWCDIVDRPAFCSTRINARRAPRFPPHQCNFDRAVPMAAVAE